jgi:subtilisin family serine protease
MKISTITGAIHQRIYLWIFALLFIGTTAFSQTVDEEIYYGDQLLFTLDDMDLTPEKVAANKATTLARIFKSFNVIEYTRAYPTSKRERLMKRYKIVCDDCDILKLQDQLESSLPRAFSKVGLIPRPRTMEDNEIKAKLGYLATLNNSCPSPYYPQEFPVNQPGWRKDLRTTNVPCAWSITRGNSAVKVAVLDEHFNVDHPDLNIVFEHPNISTASTGSTQGHGTRSAGAVATKHDNGWLCNVGGNDAANGGGVELMLYPMNENFILEAAQDGADIISNSWGYCKSSMSQSFIDDFQMIVNEATEDFNAIVLGAAGNAGTHWSFCGGSMEVIPAALDNVISVTGVDQSGLVFSNPPGSTNQFGHHNFHPTVDICAPAYGITTTCNDTNGQFCNDWGTGFGTGQYWGTSAACPFTAGIVALMLSENPYLTHDEVEAILKKTAQHFTDYCTAPYKGQVGAGYVDAYAAVLEAQQVGITNESPASIITYSSATLCETGRVTLCANKSYVATNWLMGGSGPNGTHLGSTDCIEITMPGSYALYAVNNKNFTLVQTIEITEGSCCSDSCTPTYVDEEIILDKSDFTELDNDDFTSNYNVGMLLACDSKWNWGGEGSIAFARDISEYNDGQWDAIDHTNGQTSFIIGDASTIADTRAFYITQTVDAGEIYTFSAWVRNIYAGSNPFGVSSNPTMELRVETPNGTIMTLASSGALEHEDGWVELCGTYTATTAGTAEFQVVSRQASFLYGFDFGVDDIKLVRSFSYPDITICDGDAVSIGKINNPDYNNIISFRNAMTNGFWFTLCTNCTFPVMDFPNLPTDYSMLVWDPVTACTAFETFHVDVIPMGNPECMWEGITGSGETDGLALKHQLDSNKPLDVTIFPNPAQSKQAVTVDIMIVEESDGYIELLDLTGKAILQEAYHFIPGNHRNSISLATTTLPNGVYLIRVVTGDHQETRKLSIH